jgi:LysM repeat protein
LQNAQNASQGLLLANTNGMALPATWSAGNVTVKAVSQQERIHVVKFGEWLYCIGRAYGVSPWAIAETNGIRWWPYIIFPGQKLTIPNVPWVDSPSSGPVCQAQFSAPVLPVLSPTTIPVTVVPTTVVTAVPVTPQPTSVVTVPSSACRAYYVVRRGDTLYRIGVSFGVSYTEIARVNQISNARLIYAGQTLCIP